MLEQHQPDSNGKTLEKSVKVNVYNLKIQFHNKCKKDGYTSVTSNLEYNESRTCIDASCADGELYERSEFVLNLT